MQRLSVHSSSRARLPSASARQRKGLVARPNICRLNVQTLHSTPSIQVHTRASSTEQEVKTLEGPQAEAWSSALSEFQAAVEGLDEAAYDQLLRKAFGWTTQAFWRGSKVEEVPSPQQVASVLAFLDTLGLKGADLTKVVKTFPEVLACSIPDQLQPAVDKLQNEWKLKGDVLTRTLVRRPVVLGYSLDCEGTCIGDCNRCWARF